MAIDPALIPNFLAYCLPSATVSVGIACGLLHNSIRDRWGWGRFAAATAATAAFEVTACWLAIMILGADPVILGIGAGSSPKQVLVWNFGAPTLFALGAVLWFRRSDAVNTTSQAAPIAPAAVSASRETETVRPAAVEPKGQVYSQSGDTTPLDDDLWTAALNEFSGPDRRTGVWARCFAENGGDENAAKAAYLRERVQQLKLEQAKEREDQRRQVDQLLAKFRSGAHLENDEVRRLVDLAADAHAGLTSEADRVRGRTLLHWAAFYGLEEECRSLLACGADRAAVDSRSQRPHMLASTEGVKQLLSSPVASGA